MNMSDLAKAVAAATSTSEIFERSKHTLPRHRRNLAQVHVEIVDLAAIDLLAGDRVGAVRQTLRDAVDCRKRTVKLRPC